MFFKENSAIIRKIFKIAIIILVILALLCGGIYLWLDYVIGKTGDLNDNQQTLSSSELEDLMNEDGEVEKDPIFDQAEDIFKGKDVVNILLVGQDKRPGQSTQRSDAMILCTINKSTKTLTMTSFLRDMWVYIPGYYNQRLNKTYLLGGFPLLNDTLDYNFGVSSDYNVEVDFSGFKKAIDLIGGLDITLTAAEAKYLNNPKNNGVDADEKWELKEGVNHLDGAQTLSYTRIRKIGTDFARTKRQRTVLNCMLEKAKTLNAFEVYDLAIEILPLVTTDMKTPQVLGLIVDILPMLGELKVVSQSIPMKGEYAYANKNGADVIVLDSGNLEANKMLLIEAMKEE